MKRSRLRPDAAIYTQEAKNLYLNVLDCKKYIAHLENFVDTVWESPDADLYLKKRLEKRSAAFWENERGLK